MSFNWDYGPNGRVMTDLAVTDAEQMIADGLHTGKPVRQEILAAAIRKLAPQFNYTDAEMVRRFAAKNLHLGIDKLTLDGADSAPAIPESGQNQASPAVDPLRSSDTGKQQ